MRYSDNTNNGDTDMATRAITLTLDLTASVARYYDQAVYEYDTLFTDELEAVLSDCLMRQKCVDINRLVIDIAEECRLAFEAFEREQAEDLMLERGATCYG